jgi:hypothetical protein
MHWLGAERVPLRSEVARLVCVGDGVLRSPRASGKNEKDTKATKDHKDWALTPPALAGGAAKQIKVGE